MATTAPTSLPKSRLAFQHSVVAPTKMIVRGSVVSANYVLPRGQGFGRCRAVQGRRSAQSLQALPECSASMVLPTNDSTVAGPFSARLSVQAAAPKPSSGKGGGAAVLQRSKSEVRQKAKQTAPKLDDGVGGGGLGKGIFNGGGGGDDGGDDDDYSGGMGGEGDGDGDGDGFFRAVAAELYDMRALAAVLEEWRRGLGELPFLLRQAAQMGLLSSASLVRFMTLDARPGLARAATRALPADLARGVVGRLMADPAFMQKLALEQVITAAVALVGEKKARGDAFWHELDLVTANLLPLLAANAALVYLVAPSRAAPRPEGAPWRAALSALPNNVFDAATPLRRYTPAARAAAAGVKAAQLCGVGLVAGAAQSVLGKVALAARGGESVASPNVPPPRLRQSALGFAAAWGVFANARYQVVAGVDRYLFGHASYLWSYLALSGALRAASTALGDPTRLYLQGIVPAPRCQEAMPGAASTALPLVKSGVAAAATGVAAAAKKKRRRRPAGFEMGMGAAA